MRWRSVKKEIEREHGQLKEGVSKIEECLVQEKRARQDGNKKAHEKLLQNLLGRKGMGERRWRRNQR